jgi:hypothetical protein
MSAITRYFAALNLAAPIPLYVKGTRVIVAKMTNNPDLPNPSPTLVQATADIDALDLADQATLKGPKGSAADRDAKLLVVRADMRMLKAFVQGAADAHLPRSKVIIEGAGMIAVALGGRFKPDLAAKYGAIPTVVDLYARAAKVPVAYEWQMSVDQQKTWVDLPATVRAQTTVTGLTPATIYAFRFRTLTAAGLSDWSMVVTIIAH